MDSLTEHQFHTVWTTAVGRDGYNKRFFSDLLTDMIDKGLVIKTTPKPVTETEDKFRKLLMEWEPECGLNNVKDGNVDYNEALSFQNDIGFDELDTVEFIMEIEEVFNVSLPDDQAEGIKTVRDALSVLQTALK